MHAPVFQRLCLQEALPACLWGVALCGRAEGFGDEVTLLGDRASETSSQGSVRSLACAQGDFKDVGGSCRRSQPSAEEEVTGHWSHFMGSTWGCAAFPPPPGARGRVV